MSTTKSCPFCAETIQAAAIKCRYCGSDLAASVPAAPHAADAGAPGGMAPAPAPSGRRPPEPSRRYWTTFRILFALITVPAVLFLALAAGTALTVGGVAATRIVPAPRFVVGDVDSEGCGRLLDVCARVTCNVVNAGDAAGTANVELSYEQRGKSPFVASETIRLSPGERKLVTHDFGEAGLLDEEPKVRCVVR